MADRRLDFGSAFDDMRLRSPPNWTALCFGAGMTVLHLCIVIPAFLAGRFEGYMSLIFATLFLTATVLTWFARYEVGILVSRKLVRTRIGVGWLRFEKEIPFDAIRGVRLTLLEDLPASESRIELLSGDDDIECPPSEVPRQEALMLALALGVPLTKVISTDKPQPSPSDSSIN